MCFQFVFISLFLCCNEMSVHENNEIFNTLQRKLNGVTQIINSYVNYRLPYDSTRQRLLQQEHADRVKQEHTGQTRTSVSDKEQIKQEGVIGDDPSKLPICWYDGHTFNWDAFGLPLRRVNVPEDKPVGDVHIDREGRVHLEKVATGPHTRVDTPTTCVYVCMGTFCSFSCMKAYLWEQSKFSHCKERIHTMLMEQYMYFNRMPREPASGLSLFQSYYTSSVMYGDCRSQSHLNRKSALIKKNFLLRADGMPSFQSLLPAPPRELLMERLVDIDTFRRMSEHSVFQVNVPPSIGSDMIIEKFRDMHRNLELQLAFQSTKQIPDNSVPVSRPTKRQIAPAARKRAANTSKSSAQKRKRMVQPNIIQELNMHVHSTEKA